MAQNQTDETIGIEAHSSDWSKATTAIGLYRRRGPRDRDRRDDADELIRAINQQAEDRTFSVVEIDAALLETLWSALAWYETEVDSPQSVRRFSLAVAEAARGR